MKIHNSNSLSDKELLNACTTGDEGAWYSFMRRFERLITSTIFRTAILHGTRLSKEETEDCRQSFWASLIFNDYKRLRSYKGLNGCSVASWLRTCTVRHTINFIISLKHVSSIDTLLNDSSDANKTEEGLIDKIHFQKRLTILKEECKKILSPREWLFMEFYFIDEISIDEIADIMNISRSTLYVMKYRIARKIKKIKRNLGL